ncbi:MAG: hypothetical protein IPF92_29960 [Myxococcales bacterium]|nr:hypothetical protein [Myxococcales bacterium]MBL0196907.1 hypothetical protein [Myxococcales bacterium]HQY64100.1 hypothetical protein [Polyangiaceae bacterium]
MRLLTIGLALLPLLALPLLHCGGPTCPGSRVQSADGTCVREDIADFIACVNNSGSKQLSREDAKRISASAAQVGGSAEWSDSMRQQYSGPAEQHQAAVIEQCVRMTSHAPGATPHQAPQDDYEARAKACRERRATSECTVDADCCLGERCIDPCASAASPASKSLLAQACPKPRCGPK